PRSAFWIGQHEAVGLIAVDEGRTENRPGTLIKRLGPPGEGGNLPASKRPEVKFAPGLDSGHAVSGHAGADEYNRAGLAQDVGQKHGSGRDHTLNDESGFS